MRMNYDFKIKVNQKYIMNKFISILEGIYKDSLKAFRERN